MTTTPCVDNLTRRRTAKQEEVLRQRRPRASDSKPRFMKKVCSKTCGFCRPPRGGRGGGGEGAGGAARVENTPGKKKEARPRGVVREQRRRTRKVSAPRHRPLLPAPPPPSGDLPRWFFTRRRPLAHPALAVREEEDPQRVPRDVRGGPTRGAPTARNRAYEPTVSRGPTVPSRAARRHSSRAKSSSGSPVSSLSASARTTTRAAARAATTPTTTVRRERATRRRAPTAPARRSETSRVRGVLAGIGEWATAGARCRERRGGRRAGGGCGRRSSVGTSAGVVNRISPLARTTRTTLYGFA